MATAKKAPVKKAAAAATKASAAPVKKAAVPAKKAAPVKKAAGPAPKAAPTKRAAANAPAAKSPAPAKSAAPAPAKKAVSAPVKSVPAPAKKVVAPPPAPAPTAAAKQPVAAPVSAPAKKPAITRVGSTAPEKAPIKGVTKEGIAYTKDFDAKFLTSMRALLLEEKASLVGQAVRLEDEANQIIEEQEMGDVQFDDEGGEGDTMVVERERDLALSAQARQTVADIEAALERLIIGTYGYSVESGRPIPRERLEALPWAIVLVEEKVGGIGRR